MSLISRPEIETFYHTPVMEYIVSALKEISRKDAEELSKYININRSCDSIALQVAEFKGRQAMLEKLLSHEALIDFLQEFVQPLEEER